MYSQKPGSSPAQQEAVDNSIFYEKAKPWWPGSRHELGKVPLTTYSDFIKDTRKKNRVKQVVFLKDGETLLYRGKVIITCSGEYSSWPPLRCRILLNMFINRGDCAIYQKKKA